MVLFILACSFVLSNNNVAKGIDEVCGLARLNLLNCRYIYLHLC